MKISIAIPAHNEEAVIANNLKILSNTIPNLLNGHDWEILVVENGSNDTTFKLAKQAAAQDSKIKALSINQAGKGRAIKTAWNTAAADLLVFMDADLATNIKHLPDLITQALDRAQLIIGNRWHQNSKTKRSFIRTVCSKIYNLIAKLVLKTPIDDHQCGFKAVTSEAWKKISPLMESDGWFFDSELLGLAEHFNFRIVEIPVDWSEKRFGKDKSQVKIFQTAKNLLVNLFWLKKRLAHLQKK